MPRISKFWLDILAGGGLMVTLLVVILLDRRVAPRAAQAAVQGSTGDLQVNVISSGPARIGAPKKLKLAVTPSDRSVSTDTNMLEPWDDMGRLLVKLGSGYRFDVLLPQDIANHPAKLDRYDVLFLTCGRGGEEMKDALRNFVARGGTLYASDFRYDAVAAAFPEVVSRDKASGTANQEVIADIVDPGLRDAIGDSTIKLKFDMSQWKTAAFAGPRVAPLIKGKFRKERFPNDRKGVPAEGLFLVKFLHGKGTVIFTSFHNEKQNTEIEGKLLEHLVFQLVTASANAEVSETNEQAGFQPAKSNLLSTPKTNLEVTKTYFHAKDGPLRFSLAFRDEGDTKLGLVLRSPDGKSFTRDCSTTTILEAPDAKAGEWSYTIIAKQLPHENFPFSVSFGAKK